LQLPMAIASGRVGIDGPVRKLVLVWPILHELARRRHEERLSTRQARAGDPEAADHPGGFTVEQRRLLDEAADHAYRFHEGALEFAQAGPGHFWSIECVDVYKRFGPNQVLNGLTPGIPEGMITVVLGPSGTGKSARVEDVGRAKAANRMAGERSGGMRKRAGFAGALVVEREIVMFDEAGSGLEPVRTARLCELIHGMHRQHGGTDIVVTHDIAS